MPDIEKITICGNVTTGLGGGKFYPQQKIYREQFERHLGNAIYEGTLNVKVPGIEQYKLQALTERSGIVIEGADTEEGRLVPLKYFPARIGSTECALITPSRTHKSPLLEVISSNHLRSTLGLEDKDSVDVEVELVGEFYEAKAERTGRVFREPKFETELEIDGVKYMVSDSLELAEGGAATCVDLGVTRHQLPLVLRAELPGLTPLGYKELMALLQSDAYPHYVTPPKEPQSQKAWYSPIANILRDGRNSILLDGLIPDRISGEFNPDSYAHRVVLDPIEDAKPSFKPQSLDPQTRYPREVGEGLPVKTKMRLWNVQPRQTDEVPGNFHIVFDVNPEGFHMNAQVLNRDGDTECPCLILVSKPA